MTRIAPVGVAVVAALLVIGTPSLPAPGGETAEVVVLLSAPPLARAPGTGERIDAEQRAFREELDDAGPGRASRMALPARRERLLAHAARRRRRAPRPPAWRSRRPARRELRPAGRPPRHSRSAPPRSGGRRSTPRARESRSGSSTRASTPSIRTSTRPGTRCRRASPRDSSDSRPRR